MPGRGLYSWRQARPLSSRVAPELPIHESHLLAVDLTGITKGGAAHVLGEERFVRGQARAQRLRDPERLGAAQKPAHAVHRRLIEAQGGALVLAQGGFGDPRRDVGVAVAIAADPAREAEEHRHLEGLARVLPLQGLAQPPSQHGHEIEERGLEVVEAVDDLVHHLEALVTRLFRLPERHHLLAHELDHGLLLVGGGRGEVEPAQGLGDAAELGEHGPALGLGGMSGEDGHDEEPAHQGLDLRGRHAFLAEQADRRGDGLAHGLAAGLGLVGAPPQDADALFFLGQVDELEVGRERLHHPSRLGEGQGLDALEQAQARGGVACAMRLGQGPNLLDAVEEGLAFLLDQGLAQKVAEAMNLLREGVCHGRRRS